MLCCTLLRYIMRYDCFSSTAARCSMPGNLHLEQSPRFTKQSSHCFFLLLWTHRIVTQQRQQKSQQNATVGARWNYARVQVRKQICMFKTRASERTHPCWFEYWGRGRATRCERDEEHAARLWSSQCYVPARIHKVTEHVRTCLPGMWFKVQMIMNKQEAEPHVVREGLFVSWAGTGEQCLWELGRIWSGKKEGKKERRENRGKM